MADKVNGKKLLTYDAVSDMVTANNTIITYTGIVDMSLNNVFLEKTGGTFKNGVTFDTTKSFVILNFMSDDRVGGGTLLGSLATLNGDMPLTGILFANFANDGTHVSVYISPVSNYTKWAVACKGNKMLETAQCDGANMNMQLHLSYN